MGGAEKQFTQLINLLSANHEVFAITLESTRVDFYKINNHIKRYSCNQKKQNSFFHKVTNLIKIITTIRKIVKDIKPTVIISFLPIPSLIILMATFDNKAKKVVSIRNNPSYTNYSFFWKLVDFFVTNSIDTMVVQTKTLQKELKKKHKHKKIISIANFKSDLKLKKTEWKNTIYPPKKPFLLAVGKIHMQKGLDILIKSYFEVLRKGHNIDLYILSNSKNIDFKYLKLLKTLLKDFNITKKVKIIYDVRNLNQWYKKCHLYILCSRYEGYPNSLVEAMRNSCDIISFDCKFGPKEILQNKKYLIKKPSILKLTDCIVSTLKDGYKKKNIIKEINQYNDANIIKKWNAVI